MHIWSSFKQIYLKNIQDKNVYFKEIKIFIIKITLIYIENWITHIIFLPTPNTDNNIIISN